MSKGHEELGTAAAGGGVLQPNNSTEDDHVVPSIFDQSRGLWARTSPKVISANMSPRGDSEPMAFGAQGALGSWLHTWHWQPLMLWLACWQDTSLPAQPSTDGPTRMLRLWRMMHRNAGRVLDISSITKESLEELTFDRDLRPTLLKRCAEGTIQQLQGVINSQAHGGFADPRARGSGGGVEQGELSLCCPCLQS